MSAAAAALEAAVAQVLDQAQAARRELAYVLTKGRPARDGGLRIELDASEAARIRRLIT